MNPIKLNITFLLARSRLNQAGKCSIRCRITYFRSRHEFATGLFINPNHWNSKLQQAKPPNEDNNYINTQISLIKQKINQAFLYLQVNNETIVVEDIYKQYKGVKLDKELGLIEVYNQYNQRIKKLIGIEIKLVTYNKYLESMRHLASFIIWKYKSKEIMLKDLNFNFILDYEYYLKTEKKLQQSTLNKAIQRVRKVLSYAINQNYLQKDPFGGYMQTRIKKQVVYLTTEELLSLEQYAFSQIRLEQVKDMFVFCCYTGLAYNEMAKLETKHIIIGFDGNKWIQMTRDKTNKLISVPLLQKSTTIIEKYQNQETTYLLPRISNQKFNSYLKEIAEIVGIEKNLTHHIARKTFATTVLLYNDVPMEIVSELLGHSKMSITQEYYGKIVQSKVSQSIASLEEKLK
jgi:site-specific recombinase XerD